ncbi:MAG TPA: CheR family methyltransferase, partial [Puia sp.]|nr:CheR family methyltransferase [Puia sp.]
MDKSKEPGEGSSSALQFPVVGIGASAGGLDAVKRFLHSIPEKSGMAYVFVQHLSPMHESALPEILGKKAHIPVKKITDNIHLEKDNLYIIPENKIVTAVDGILKLAPLGDPKQKAKVIDLFFSSLAIVHQSFAVGVVLSGTLDDGTLGLQVIKAYGGLTFAQDEASAAFEGMPKNAINKGVVDFVLPPEKIAEHLLAINHLFPEDDSKKEAAKAAPLQDEQIFNQILTVLRVRRGVDFTYYKQATIKRRIIRRMALSLIERPETYLEFLRESKAEQDNLYNDMLISVTQFFRDPQSFDFLCQTIFPAILKQKTGKDSFRIWVAGCASGEEAYSMAICLQEHLGGKASGMKIQIFATDISEIAIARARNGIYKSTELEGLSASRIEQFFTKLDGNYQVNKEIRDLCIFAHHNLLKDPPFSKMDLIGCRNVLIYLEPILQKRALNTFHYALNEQGFLMLGKSETIINNPDLFAAYQANEKIFRKKGVRGRFMQVASPRTEENFKEVDKKIPNEDAKKDVFKLADAIVLSKHAPSGFLVNEHFDIKQFRGKTDSWIDPSPGVASLDVLAMVRGGLAFELRNLLHQAKKTNANARKENILFMANDREQYVNLDVTPVPGVAEPHYLILFENGTGPGTNQVSRSVDLYDGGEQGPESLMLEIEQLKKELLRARSDMRTVTEEQEAANEELQSANQELLSNSEELQSLNEELETSTEELQSTNEEIIIVNTELLDRNEQLNNARVYAEAIINTIRDPLVILDKNLRVRRATNGFYQTFKVTEKEAEGAYFYELGNKQWDIPSLRNLLEAVLPEKKALTDFNITHVFPVIGRKVLILNTRKLDRDNGEQLILLAIED